MMTPVRRALRRSRATARSWGALALRYVGQGSAWQEFQAGGYHPESTVRLYEALRRSGVRCRYAVVGSGGSHGGSTFQTLKLLVHRDDLDRAREVFWSQSTRRP